MFEAIEPLTNLNKEIEKCIISEEEWHDDASYNLKYSKTNEADKR